MPTTPHDKQIRGLGLYMRLGQIVSINNGELLIQITEITKNHVRVRIRGDREKYDVGRAASMPEHPDQPTQET